MSMALQQFKSHNIPRHRCPIPTRALNSDSDSDSDVNVDRDSSVSVPCDLPGPLAGTVDEGGLPHSCCALASPLLYEARGRSSVRTVSTHAQSGDPRRVSFRSRGKDAVRSLGGGRECRGGRSSGGLQVTLIATLSTQLDGTECLRSGMWHGCGEIWGRTAPGVKVSRIKQRRSPRSVTRKRSR